MASIAADAGKAGPSRAWYLLSAAIVIATIAVFAYFLLSRLNTLSGNLTQLVVPGQIDLVFGAQAPDLAHFFNGVFDGGFRIGAGALLGSWVTRSRCPEARA